MTRIEALRRFYAEEVVAVANLSSPALVDAFASVAREQFLGPGPWFIQKDPSRSGIDAYRRTPDDDPAHIYHNVLVAIDPERQLNNGHPSSLALWLSSLQVHPGERVVHVGCGVGYYTAILAELVGPSGRVTGIEIDESLAGRARSNLADQPWVEVVHGDGSCVPACDAMFVNAGCTGPRPEWLDALAEGARLVFPLTATNPERGGGPGVMLKIHRAGERLSVSAVSQVAIFPCAGARDPEENAALLEFARRGYQATGLFRTLRRDAHLVGPSCLLHTARYCLAGE